MDSVRSLCEHTAWLDHATVRAMSLGNDVVADYRQAQAGA